VEQSSTAIEINVILNVSYYILDGKRGIVLGYVVRGSHFTLPYFQDTVKCKKYCGFEFETKFTLFSSQNCVSLQSLCVIAIQKITTGAEKNIRMVRHINALHLI